jgi:cell division protein FtsI/penicillin-binding protein 2
MNSKQRFRARIILGGIVVAACGLGIVLYGMQILHGSEYVAKAEKQYVKPTTTIFDRGSISFTSKDGTHPAAATLSSNYLVYMSPKLIKDPQGTYQALSQYLTLDQEQFLKKAAIANDPYEELSKKIEAPLAQQITGLSLTGVGVTKATIRSYPGGSLAAHVLGIVGESENTAGTIEGRYGLERAYENILSRPHTSASANIFAQLFTNVHDTVFSTDSAHGDIVTTIEPTVQAYLEKILGKTSDQWKADEIGGIIMDPKTGEIIAMASLPDFDPNDISKLKNVAVLSDPLVEHAYEMGSIMKPLTVGTGLDSGAITPTSTYDDTGTMTLSGKKIANFDGKARGPATPVQEILSQSLNVGAATVALKVGKDDFAKYFASFGFGSKTGIDQPNETSGLTTNLKTGRDIEIATMAYGQGIALSPVAMTRALAILANKGKLPQPHLVQEIDYIDGTKKVMPTDGGAQVLKPETTEIVTKMLVKVVDEALRKGALKMDHYSVAAKTGTAQIADPATKGYYPDRYLHSFFGYFPAYEPKFIVFLYQKYPKGAQYASETLAEPFNELTKFLIDYYNVPPDR